MSEAGEQILCARHGRTAATYVCRHLQLGCGCGFHDSGAEGDPWPDAWCDRCQAILDRDGEWTDENLPASELAVLCTGCYQEVRESNARVPQPIRPGQLAVSEAEYRELARAAYAWCEGRKAQATARWAFTRREKWFYDGDQRTMRFYDVDGPTVVADAALAGSFSTTSRTWMWAWGNENCDDLERRRVAPARIFGEVRGIGKLAEAHWPADEVDAWEVTQIAAYLLGAEAIYRAPMDHLLVFMLLRNFRLEAAGPPPGN